MKIQLQTAYMTLLESALFRTTATIIHTPDLILVVDPNWLPTEVMEIQELVKRLKRDRPVYMLFTHSDYDHIIAAQAIPEAQTIATAAFVANPKKEKILEQIRTFDDEYYLQRDYPIAYPVIDHVIAQNGQTLEIGNIQLKFHLTPGHNPDGLFCFVQDLGIWIAGDYLSNIEFPYIYHSSIQYEEVLQKSRHFWDQHQLKLLIPGHGDHTADPREVQRRIDNDLHYIRELRRALSEGRVPTMEELWQPIRHPRIMRTFHEANIQLIKKEMAIH